MRIAISCSCLTMIIILLVMIHCSIINKNYRDIEVNSNINDAFYYAVDKISYNYLHTDNSGLSADTLLDSTMYEFNVAFSRCINSDGTFTISVLYADLDKLILDIMITDEYDYGFMHQKGRTVCQRTIRLN